MSDKGLLTKEQEKFLKEKIDQAIKGNVIVEPISDLAINFLIPFLDDKYADELIQKWNISDELLSSIRRAIDAAMVEDWVAVAEATEEVLVNHINTPIGDAYERLIIKGVFSILLGLLSKPKDQ